MFGFWKTWKALEARGIMGINRRNADYVLKYNKRSLYPIVDDKILTKERAIAAGIHVPELYGVISTEKEIDKLDEIIGGRSDFVIKPAAGAGGCQRYRRRSSGPGTRMLINLPRRSWGAVKRAGVAGCRIFR